MGASSDSLVGLGIPPEAAKFIGDVPGAATLAGTTAGGATALAGTLCIVTAASSQTGGILPTHNVGRTVKVVNTSATAAVIYPPTGGQINGLSANTGVSVPANKAAEFQAIAVTAGVTSYSANVSA